MPKSWSTTLFANLYITHGSTWGVLMMLL